jgi:hypothetical protein
VSGVERLNEQYPKDGLECFNEVVTKSEATITADDTGKHSYVGCDVKDGVFRILFGVGYLGTNISELSYYHIPKAINDAPRTSDFPLLVKGSIRKDYDAGIPAVRTAIAEIIAIPADDLILDPNFLANYKKMKAHKDQSSWREEVFGEVALQYFQGLKGQLEYQKFGGDEMMQEGLLEVVHKKTFQLRVVDKLVKGSYNEIVIEDGVAYLQVCPTGFIDPNNTDVSFPTFEDNSGLLVFKRRRRRLQPLESLIIRSEISPICQCTTREIL